MNQGGTTGTPLGSSGEGSGKTFLEMRIEHLEKQQQGMALLREYAKHQERLDNPYGVRKSLIWLRTLQRMKQPNISNAYSRILQEK